MVASERTASAVMDASRLQQEEGAVPQLALALDGVGNTKGTLTLVPRRLSDVVEAGLVDQLRTVGDDVPGPGRQALGEEAADEVVGVAEPRRVSPATQQQQTRGLDPARGQHEDPGPDEEVGAVVTPDGGPVHPVRVMLVGAAR
jgi:hypothetical protein